MNSVAHIVLIRVDFMFKEIGVRKNVQDWIEAVGISMAFRYGDSSIRFLAQSQKKVALRSN
jgi:hypothetical protein